MWVFFHSLGHGLVCPSTLTRSHPGRYIGKWVGLLLGLLVCNTYGLDVPPRVLVPTLVLLGCTMISRNSFLTGSILLIVWPCIYHVKLDTARVYPPTTCHGSELPNSFGQLAPMSHRCQADSPLRLLAKHANSRKTWTHPWFSVQCPYVMHVKCVHELCSLLSHIPTYLHII